MLGFRGALRYLYPGFQDGFELECRNKPRARRYGFVERTADDPVWVTTNQVGVFVRRPAAVEEAGRTPAVIEALLHPSPRS